MNQEMERQKSVELTKNWQTWKAEGLVSTWQTWKKTIPKKKGSWLPPPSPMEAGTWM